MSPSKSKNLTPSYAVIQGLYWMYFAAIMSFSGFFLLSGGFTNTQIGILAAIAGLLSAVLQPVLAGYADQPQSPSLKKLIQMLYFLQLILVIGLFLSHSLILTGLLYGSSIALLHRLSVNIQMEIHFLYVIQLFHWHPVANGSRTVKTLAQFPRLSFHKCHLPV